MGRQRIRHGTGHSKHDKQAQHTPPHIFERSEQIRGQEAWFCGHRISARTQGEEDMSSSNSLHSTQGLAMTITSGIADVKASLSALSLEPTAWSTRLGVPATFSCYGKVRVSEGGRYGKSSTCAG